MPGAEPDDYRRINYDGAANVFAAAQEAGVRKFIFASSAQVYGINDPVRIDQFPILESNYLPTPEDGQSDYGALKVEFERHLAEAAPRGETQAVALRLECPGVLSDSPVNLYTSTSIENTVAGFARAIEAELDAPSRPSTSSTAGSTPRWWTYRPSCASAGPTSPTTRGATSP